MTGVIVVATGPDADFDDRLCEEVPVWFVAIEDEDGEVCSKVWTCRSRSRAQSLVREIARDRRLPFQDETAPAF